MNEIEGAKEHTSKLQQRILQWEKFEDKIQTNIGTKVKREKRYENTVKCKIVNEQIQEE